MAVSALFPEPPIKQVHGYKPHALSLYEYCAYSSKPGAVKQRAYWNTVFHRCRLAAHTKADIRGRVKCKKDDQFLSAIFELFLYEFLHHMNLKLRSGARLSGRPDYKVLHRSQSNFHLEATCQMGDFTPDVEQRRRDAITDVIRSTWSEHFRVAISFRGRCSRDGHIKVFRNEFRQWLKGLNWNDLLRVKSTSEAKMNAWEKEFDVNGLRVFVLPIAIDPPKSSEPHGLVMFGPVGRMILIRTGRHLRKKVRDKQKQVRGARLPVVIAVNEVAEQLDEDDILSALFGELSTDICLTGGKETGIRHQRGPQGIWTSCGLPINRSIEAVMFFNKVDFFARPVRKPLIVLNPFIKRNRVPRGLPHLDYYLPTRDGMQLNPIGEVALSSDNSWLETWPIR